MRASRTTILPALLFLLFALGACAHRGAPPRFPGAIALPDDTSAPASAALGAAVVETAMSLQGTSYRNGGTDASGFDCSGFVQYVFAQHGVAVARSVREQYSTGEAIARSELRPGDLVFFTTVASGPSHVGIVVADDLFVHAPSERGVVRTDHLSGNYWTQRYVGARRLR